MSVCIKLLVNTKLTRQKRMKIGVTVILEVVQLYIIKEKFKMDLSTQ